MGMESLMNTLKKVLWLNVSSMNQEPIVTGLQKVTKDKFEFETYFYDEGKEAQLHYEGAVDHNIIRKVNSFQPEIIIYSGPAGGKCKPYTETLAWMRDKAKTVCYVLDGGCPEWHPLLQEYQDKNVFDLVANLDGNPEWPKRSKDITLWQVTDEEFFKEKLVKDIRIGFAGGTGSKHRRDMLDVLKKKCDLVIAERFETWGTYKHFADFMKRCQMTVNFPETGSGRAYHLKNRVLEAGFAGVCLFEKKNPVTELYFTPNVDYVQYETLDELVDRINLISPEGIKSKAEHLSLRCWNEYTSDKVWNTILTTLLA